MKIETWSSQEGIDRLSKSPCHASYYWDFYNPEADPYEEEATCPSSQLFTQAELYFIADLADNSRIPLDASPIQSEASYSHNSGTEMMNDYSMVTKKKFIIGTFSVLVKEVMREEGIGGELIIQGNKSDKTWPEINLYSALCKFFKKSPW